jgi:hypothetical protein
VDHNPCAPRPRNLDPPGEGIPPAVGEPAGALHAAGPAGVEHQPARPDRWGRPGRGCSPAVAARVGDVRGDLLQRAGSGMPGAGYGGSVIRGGHRRWVRQDVRRRLDQPLPDDEE